MFDDFGIFLTGQERWIDMYATKTHPIKEIQIQRMSFQELDDNL